MLSRKTKYGLKALSFLARREHNEPVQIEVISKAENISQKFLESILLTLKKAGYLGAKKGKGGGYYLLEKSRNTPIAAFYRVLEGPIAMVPCVSLNFYEKCEEILKFQNLKFLKLNKENELQNEDSGKFKYNILGWIKNNYINLEKHNKIQTYKFYLTKEQFETIEIQLKQNKSKNINSKLRDMSVYTSTNQFFYDVTIN